MSPNRIIVALGFSGGVAMIGLRRRALAPSGAIGAIAMGSVTYCAGTWRWSTVLLTFFAGSSALSRLEQRRATISPARDIVAKGSRRDLAQTLANGGVGAAAAIAYALYPVPPFAAAFAASIAAANADTWATEIGGASTAMPRMIHTGKPALSGTSGAVTVRGLAAAAAGSALIGAVSTVAVPELRSARSLAATSLAGFCGTVADSLAGALIQARFRCPACGALTEKRTHCRGATTIHKSGWQWCTNDVVNVVCTIAGAATGILLSDGLVAKRPPTERHGRAVPPGSSHPNKRQALRPLTIGARRR